MSEITVQDVVDWLAGLAKDAYPEDALCEGRPDLKVSGALVCWLANQGARRAAIDRGANVIVAHEEQYFAQPSQDPGCPSADTWQANRRIREFYDKQGVAFIRSHRALDAYCIPRVLGDHLGFPPPVIHEGRKGYEFTLVYDLAPVTFAGLVERLKKAIGATMVRVSAGDEGTVFHRVGLGWGGVSNCRNLQYMELLRRRGVEVVIGGEIDEFALEYYRESGMRWIELGHYATEIIGLEKVARDMAAQFPDIPVTCFRDGPRIAFA